MILVSGKFLDLVDHAGEHVCIIVALLSLKYHAETLESHSSINVVVREQFKFAVRLSVILHEHKVPDFDHERVALVHEVASRNGCNLFVASEVNVDFTARAAWTGVTHFPEVVMLVSQKDMVLRQELEPCLVSLLVHRGPVFLGAFEHGSIKLGLVNLVYVRKKFPCPCDRLCLEIVSETPVSEHLEHRMMVRVVSHFLQVIVLSAHSETFLGVGRAMCLRRNIPEEYVFELVHTGIGEHKRRVVLHDHRS